MPPLSRTLSRAAGLVLTAIAGTLLVAMMLLTVVDVVGRYIFAMPVVGAFEATEVMLALSIFAGLPLVTARGEHVSVRLLVDHAPAGARRLSAILADVAVAAALAGAAYLLFQRGEALAQYGDTTVLLRIPLAPVAYALAALAAISAVAATVRALTAGRRS